VDGDGRLDAVVRVGVEVREAVEVVAFLGRNGRLSVVAESSNLLVAVCPELVGPVGGVVGHVQA